MLYFDIPDTQIDLLLRIFNTLVIFSVFTLMSISYTHKRLGQKYARNKKKAPSISHYKTLSKILFVSSMLITLFSFWYSTKFLLRVDHSIYCQTLGAFIVLTGYLKLSSSFEQLGNNYSPLFDAYLPFQIVSRGNYRIIRHPIYLYNLFISFGLAIASGSVLVLVNALIGLAFVLKAIQLEEKYLLQKFSDYKTYQKNTWKLIPYFY